MKSLLVITFIFAPLSFLLSRAEVRVTAIRSTDFANFTYPWTDDLVDTSSPQRTFTLSKGERPATRDARGFVDEMGVYLASVGYGDVTGDGVEEALVAMSVQTGGSAIPGLVYVYTMGDSQPKLLWHFSTGDRADGGLRRVIAEGGGLVVELNSPDASRGDCCPTRFTRRWYEWRDGGFGGVREETLPIAEAN